MTDDPRARRRTTLVAAGATAVLLLGCGVAAGLLRDGPGPGPAPGPADLASGPAAPGAWTELPAAPLTPRHDSVGAWTGSELVVVGGRTGRPCAPGTRCVPVGDLQRDGAAYDPETATWRPIADAPAPVEGSAVWSGSEVVVAGTAGTYAYEPDTDVWRTLGRARVPTESAPPVVTEEGIVYSSYFQGARGGSPDLVLDPDSGTWSRLPRDPFGESYDRSVAWDGGRLWLLSMSVDEHVGASSGAPSRLAVLEGGIREGTWRVVEEQTPRLTYGQLLWSSGDRLVVTPASRWAGQVYDPATRTWTTTPAGTEPPGCALPPTGPGLEWVAGGGPTLVAAAGRTAYVGSCPGLPDPDVAAWAGEDLLGWGGPNEDHSAGTATGYRTGDGTEPCPAALPLAERATYGFGPGGPATSEPDLPRPEEAWVCAYGSYDVAPPGTDGAWLEWRLDRGPVALGADDLAALSEDLADLAPPPDEFGCDDDLGPRYLLSYRAGEQVVGVVVDDYGCREVRLTGDPATVLPGASRVDGLVPGVLFAPDGFADRLRGALG